MLQAGEDKRSWSRGCWSAALVAALSVLALGLHGQAPEASGAPATPAPVVEQPGFDVSLLEVGDNKDTVGFYSVRIGKLLGLPGMAKISDNLAPLLTQATGLELIGKLSEIEQVAGRMTVTIEPKKPAPNRAVMMSLSMIRFKHDRDWAKELEKAFGKFKTCKHGDETYFEVEVPWPLRALLGSQRTMNIYPVDGRTLLAGESAETIKKIIDGKKGRSGKPSWYEQWRQVEQGTFAIVVKDAHKRMKGILTSEDANAKIPAEDRSLLEALEKIFAKTDSLVVGFDLGTSASLKIRQNAVASEDLPMIARQWESLWKTIQSRLAADSPGKDRDGAENALRQILSDLSKKPAMRLTEKGVNVDSESIDGMKALNKAIQEMFSLE